MAAQNDWPTPDLATLQRWTFVIGRMQQMMLEHGLKQLESGAALPALPAMPATLPSFDPAALVKAQENFWAEGVALWRRFLDPAAAPDPTPEQDRRFAAPEWRDHPLFAMIRQSYALVADHLLKGVDTVEGLDEKQKAQARFAARTFADALSPSNFALTNPQVLQKTIETGGENLLVGLERMLADLGKGQLAHVAEGAFELGRNLASTPGQVVHQTPLYQLIQYDPVTPKVHSVPLIIFPPWINRFYILDLNPEKSFIRWAVA